MTKAIRGKAAKKRAQRRKRMKYILIVESILLICAVIIGFALFPRKTILPVQQTVMEPGAKIFVGTLK